uniref:Uncharacterized protein n=1 Tax=Sus scrofa TaxID=9823 RepID=A0A8D1Y2W0_PIG
MAIFKILIFSNPGAWNIFPFLYIFFNFLDECFIVFSIYKSFTSLVRCIPRSLIFWGAILKGIVFLYSFSNISLLVYRNVTDFLMLILYPAILLNLLINSSSFWVEALGFSIYSIMSSAYNSDNFTSCLPIWMPFISLVCLIAVATVARTSSAMLNNSGESGHPCLVPDFSGKAFSFCPLSIIFAVGLW